MPRSLSESVEEYDALQDFKEWFPKHLADFEMVVSRPDPRDMAVTVIFRVPEGPIREFDTGGESDMRGFYAYRQWSKLRRQL